MNTSVLLRSIVIVPMAAAVAVAACTAPGDAGSEEPTARTGSTLVTAPRLPRNFMPVGPGLGSPQPPDTPEHKVFAPVDKLTYHGGPIISAVQVHTVLWGPNVDPTLKSGIDGFFQFYLTSPPFAWLSEYSTPMTGGTNQTLGTGTYTGQTTITPSAVGTPCGSQTCLSQTQIEAELANQIGAGNLPPPQKDAQGYPLSIYMTYFPPSIRINAFGQSSCTQFCAFHDAFVNGSDVVAYGVMADTSVCGFCGWPLQDNFQSFTAFSSHELAEAVTDVEVGLGNLAWYDSSASGARTGEIGDICAGDFAVYDNFNIQALWSNQDGNCIVVRPVCDATMSNAPCRTCTMADDNVKWGCSASTPFCATGASDPKLGQCVACRDSTACSGKTPICDKSGGAAQDTCRGCMSNSECAGATPLCETQGLLAGECVQCTAADKSACTGATPNCSPSTDTCVACGSNSDCSGGTPICDSTTHTCRACSSDSDCGLNGGVCATGANDPNVGKCVQCTSNAQCTPAFCDTRSDTCGACSPTAGCSNPKPICGANQMCQPCSSDGDCMGNPHGSACETSGTAAGSCVPCTASNASACGAGMVCSPDNLCVACGGDGGSCAGDGGPKGGGGGGGGGCNVGSAPSSHGAWAWLGLALAGAAARRRRR